MAGIYSLHATCPYFSITPQRSLVKVAISVTTGLRPNLPSKSSPCQMVAKIVPLPLLNILTFWFCVPRLMMVTLVVVDHRRICKGILFFPVVEYFLHEGVAQLKPPSGASHIYIFIASEINHNVTLPVSRNLTNQLPSRAWLIILVRITIKPVRHRPRRSHRFKVHSANRLLNLVPTPKISSDQTPKKETRTRS